MSPFYAGVGALLALIVAKAHSPSPSEGGVRRLQSQEKDHIWGTCGQPVSGYGVAACALSDATCSDRLSEGPAHADLELVIGNLPKSSGEEEVHVAWWAAFESPRKWQPLVSPVNVSIYPNMDQAYPKWDDVEFNGGNTVVDSTGTATIRVRSMATYFYPPHVVRPHIHLRVCRGDADVLDFDHIEFGIGEQWVKTHSQGEPIQVLSARHIENPGEAPANYNVPWVDSSLQGALLSAISEIDPSALEFSAIYQCLAKNQRYSHFSNSCTDECPPDAEDVHGQCVKLGSTGVLATFQSSWAAEVKCSIACPAIDLALLHIIRIEVAGYLQIPFQDVQVAVAWLRAAGRRLTSDDIILRTLLFTVKVQTTRYTQDEGGATLDQMLHDVSAASTILRFDVQAVAKSSEDAFAATGGVYVSTGKDPFEPSYEAASGTDGPLDFISAHREVFIACGIAMLLMIVACVALWKLRAHCKRHLMMANNKVSNKANNKANNKSNEARATGSWGLSSWSAASWIEEEPEIPDEPRPEQLDI